jgi:hypothetical protein
VRQSSQRAGSIVKGFKEHAQLPHCEKKGEKGERCCDVALSSTY